jgi:hypothetical protein
MAHGEGEGVRRKKQWSAERGRHKAAKQALSVSERELQRLRQHGATELGAPQVGRLPNLRALPWPVASKHKETGASAETSRGFRAPFEAVGPYEGSAAGVPRLSSASVSYAAPGGLTGVRPLYGAPTSGHPPPEEDAPASGCSLGRRVQMACLGLLYDAWHYGDITSETVRAEGFDSKAAFLFLRQERMPALVVFGAASLLLAVVLWCLARGLVA